MPQDPSTSSGPHGSQTTIPSNGLHVWASAGSGEKDPPRNKNGDCASPDGFCDHLGRNPYWGMELWKGQDTLLRLGLNPSITLALCLQIFAVSI